MKTLKSFALLSGLAFFALAVSAQEKCTEDQRLTAQKQTDMIAKNVTGLTSDQKNRILTVEQDFEIGIQIVCTDSKGNRDTITSKKPSLHETLDLQIKTILTANQYTQYQQMEAVQNAQGRTSKDQ
jgi:hypothetical protein